METLGGTGTASILDGLAWEWMKLKEEESAARARRLEIEERILCGMEKKDEGTVTDKTEFFRISVTYGMDRKTDSALVPTLQIPDEIRDKVFRKKYEVSVTELRKVMDYLPDIYEEIAKAVTAKPSKPSFKIEELKK